jgi:hypothetical protein
MKQWESVLVPAGAELTIHNASEEPSVVLLVLSPPPASKDPGSLDPDDATAGTG